MHNTRHFISLELNELNFELVEAYIAEGKLPTFARLLAKNGYRITESESMYEQIEPWIQWVTVHTGKSFAEHKVFRLGDIKGKNYDQIWEILERKGIKVGAISPMNAENRLSDPAFFVPDPWTKSKVSGSQFLAAFYDAIAQAVNDNADSRISFKSVVVLLAGAVRFASPRNYTRYINLVLGSRRKKWNKALFLDLLLADCFRSLTATTKPQFVTLFLNAAAHVQHHYMFSSKHVASGNKNPEWYVPPGVDPVLEVYELYDRIIGQIVLDFAGARLQLITGLHQTAYPKTTYYWRLRDHASFLKMIGIEFARVEPRMSRDFLIHFSEEAAVVDAANKLRVATAADGKKLFSVDRKGMQVFVELIYDKNIDEGFSFRVGNAEFNDLKKNVVFVAIKNGHHDGDGYLLDTMRDDTPTISGRARIPLRRVFDEIVGSFN